jgi:hypothetical protein
MRKVQCLFDALSTTVLHFDQQNRMSMLTLYSVTVVAAFAQQLTALRTRIVSILQVDYTMHILF